MSGACIHPRCDNDDAFAQTSRRPGLWRETKRAVVMSHGYVGEGLERCMKCMPYPIHKWASHISQPHPQCVDKCVRAREQRRRTLCVRARCESVEHVLQTPVVRAEPDQRREYPTVGHGRPKRMCVAGVRCCCHLCFSFLVVNGLAGGGGARHAAWFSADARDAVDTVALTAFALAGTAGPNAFLALLEAPLARRTLLHRCR